jgi:hypothetical protein
MRSRQLPVQPPRHVEIDLVQRLQVTAVHLESMPSEAARSVSLTAGWHGQSEAEIRQAATQIATPFGFATDVEASGDMVTVIFRRRAPLS